MLDLFLLETSDGVGDDGATGDSVTANDIVDAAADGLNAHAAADAGSTDAAPAGPDYGDLFQRPEFQQAIGTAVQNGLYELIAQQPYQQDQPQYDQQPDLPPLEDVMYDPQALQQYMEARDQRLIQAMANASAQHLAGVLGPYQPVLQSTAEEQWRQQTDEYYTGLETQVGRFDHDIARQLAAGIESLSGGRERDPHGVAARALAEHIKSERLAAVEEYKQSLLSRDSTPYEPGMTGSGIAGEHAPKDELDVAARWAAKRQATPV